MKILERGIFADYIFRLSSREAKERNVISPHVTVRCFRVRHVTDRKNLREGAFARFALRITSAFIAIN